GPDRRSTPAVVRGASLGCADVLPGPLHADEQGGIAAGVGVRLPKPHPIRAAQFVVVDGRPDAEHLIGGCCQRPLECHLHTIGVCGSGYAGGMTKSTVWTVVGVIVAIVIAWWLVSALFSLLWFIAKLAVVAVVAVAVYAGLRALLNRTAD